MCVDFRNLNAATVPMKFPLQNYHSILDRLGGNTIFATIDFRSGFLQIPLDEASISLTAFSTHDGLYEHTWMPFGLMNAPAFFQRTVQLALGDLVAVICEVFIDDIIVYASTAEHFLNNLQQVLENLWVVLVINYLACMRLLRNKLF